MGQTQRIEEITYGTVGQYGSYGIGSQVKGSGASNDNQVATGGIFVVGDRGRHHLSGAATTFAKSPFLRETTSNGIFISLTSSKIFSSSLERFTSAKSDSF